MPTPTLQQRLVNALIATGRGTIIPSRSRRYITLKRPDGSFLYVGKAGALRFGNTVTDSVAAPDDFKRRRLSRKASDSFQNGRCRRASRPVAIVLAPHTRIASKTLRRTYERPIDTVVKRTPIA